MVLALGKFQVSKYAAPGGSAAAGGVGAGGGLDFGLPTVGGNVFGIDQNPQLIPSNVYPNVILPGGEVLPGGGGTPLPGGVGLETPAYADHPGPFWDPTSNGGVFGTDIFREGGGGRGKTFGSRILNVNLPPMIKAGQQFPIIVSYVHQGDTFTTYKVKVQIPVLQINETSEEKRIANGGQDNIVINLTAPSPLPNAPVTGTVELIQTEGQDITVDSEVISIPTEVVPNPPTPVPPDMPIPPVPMPEPSPPPVIPPPPPVPMPPVLQLIAVNVTRGQDGGAQAIIIEATGLEPSEPATLFIYLSENPNWRNRGRHLGWDKDRKPGDGDRKRDGDHDFDITKWMDRYKDIDISKATPAGSVGTASTNVAYSYPSVSIGGITSAGNGLRINTNMPTAASIQNQVQSRINAIRSRLPPPSPVVKQLVDERIRERLNMAIPGKVDAFVQRIAAQNPASANSLRQEIEARVRETIAVAMGGGAAAAAGAPGIAVGEPHPQAPHIFKRQRVSVTASEAGTIRHVVRVQSASLTTKLNGYVVVYGHRSKRHTGRKRFSV